MKIQRSAEDYLEAMLMLQETQGYVRSIDVAEHLGVTKPSVTSILTSLMKQGVIVRQRYGKIYITDRGVLYARFYAERVADILQHFPLKEAAFTQEERYNAAVAMAVALPAREVGEKCAALYDADAARA